MRYIRHKERTLGHIYAVIVMGSAAPLVFLVDLVLEFYHRTCFPIYRMPYIKRSKYIVVDRYRLKYLNPFQKVACLYCGYVNGWVAYATKIVGETEKYWCGIMHKKGKMRVHEEEFLPYGDSEALEEFNKK